MKPILVACLFALCSCGLVSHEPVTGMYDITTNDVTNESPAGCLHGYESTVAFPMAVELDKDSQGYILSVCGPVGANCSQKQSYASSVDGYEFTIVAGGSFNMSYNTTAGHTTISGTGTTNWGGLCTWYTTFDGTKR